MLDKPQTSLSHVRNRHGDANDARAVMALETEISGQVGKAFRPCAVRDALRARQPLADCFTKLAIFCEYLHARQFPGCFGKIRLVLIAHERIDAPWRPSVTSLENTVVGIGLVVFTATKSSEWFTLTELILLSVRRKVK